MPYTINKTNGTKITVVQDGAINNSSLDIVLIGKNYSGYGEAFNENFVKLIENFSNTTQPKKPLSGQLWFDSKNKKLKLYDGAIFRSIGILENGRTKPSAANQGDLWFSVADNKLYAYSGSGSDWLLIGPVASTGNNGIFTTTITDDSPGNTHNVIQSLIDNQQSAIFSTDSTFGVPVVNSFVYNRYPKIYPGINLPNTNNNGISAYLSSGNRIGSLLWGTAASAIGMVENTSTFVAAASYLKRSELTGGFQFPAVILNDDGITLGVNRVLKLHVTNSTVGNISNIVDSRIQFNVTTATGTYTNVINIDGANGLSVVPNSTTPVMLGSSVNQFDTLYVKNINAGTTATSATITGQWALSSGSTLQATYADIAERYAADAEYDPGTVLIIGGSKEVTTTERRGHVSVAGIVSTNPAYTLNAEAGDDSTHPYIALKGRVPCYVVGPVNKGDLLVTSSKAGYAERAHANDNPNAVLARSLEDFEGTNGLIEVMVI
jgi:hypothetical protein